MAERPRAGARPRRRRRRRRDRPGRVLVALYGVFALAAGARAAVQLSTRFSEAPLAYLLSALGRRRLHGRDGRAGARRPGADGASR